MAGIKNESSIQLKMFQHAEFPRLERVAEKELGFTAGVRLEVREIPGIQVII